MAQFSRSHHHLSNYLRLSLMLLVPWGLLLSSSNNQLLVRGASGIPPPPATLLSAPSNLTYGNTSGIPQNQSSDCSRNICEEGEVCRAVECPCPENYVAMPPVGTFGKTCLPTTKLGCPEGWDTLTGADRCYRVFKRFQVSRQEASELCRKEQPNAQLAAVPSTAIANFIVHKIGEFNFDRDQPNSREDRKVWMGLKQNGSTWSDRPDGEPVSRFAINLKYWEREINRPGDSSKCTVIDVRRDEKQYYYHHGSDCLRKHSCNNVTNLAGFLCDVPRTLPEFEQPLRSLQFYVKTCCNNATPILTQEGKEIVSHWMVNGCPRYLDVDCVKYYGSFMIELDTFHSCRFNNNEKLANLLIDCDCPLPGLDGRCHEQCEKEDNRHESPFDNSTSGQRCSCNGTFDGHHCEILCKHGGRYKYDSYCSSKSNSKDLTGRLTGPLLFVSLTTASIVGPWICYCHNNRHLKDKPDDTDTNQSSQEANVDRRSWTDTNQGSQEANVDGRNLVNFDTIISVYVEEQNRTRIELPCPVYPVIDDQPPSYAKARVMNSAGNIEAASGDDEDGNPPSYAEALEMCIMPTGMSGVSSNCIK